MTEYINKAELLKYTRIYPLACVEYLDSVNVVRCKDCIHADSHTMHAVYCKAFGALRMMDWFCADGRPKGEEE